MTIMFVALCVLHSVMSFDGCKKCVRGLMVALGMDDDGWLSGGMSFGWCACV